MDSAEYEGKIASRFAAFDQDGNGYIDREDFSGAAAALLAEFGVTARSDKGQALYSGAEAFWQGMAGIADVDGDQRVTRQEFITGAAKRLRDSPQRFAEIARPFLHAVIAIADEDGAGVTPRRPSGCCSCWARTPRWRRAPPRGWTPTATAGSARRRS